MELKPYLHQAAYYETDQMAVIHHSNYIRWFEDARIHALAQMGIRYDDMEARGIMIPVVSVSAEYKTMTKFREQVRIQVTLEKYTGVRFEMGYRVYNAQTGELRCTGTSAHCFVDRNYTPRPLKKLAPDYDRCFREAWKDAREQG